MKKFLLSIFACLMAVFAVQAEEVTKSVTFSNYTAGTQYAVNEKHDLGGGLVIYTTECHFTTQLRIYSSSTHNGYVVSDALPGNITKMTFNAGNKVDELLIYGSNDGEAWTEVGSVSVTSTSYNDYEFTFTGSYNRFKLDVKGANQIRIAKMSVTYTTGNSGDGGDGGDEPETPVVEAPATPTLPAACSFDNAMTVEITGIAEGATAYYSLNSETAWELGTSVEITETTTVYAKVVKDELSSEVVSATYTKNAPVDPNVMTAEIVAKDAGYENGVAVESLTFGDVTATFDKGTGSTLPAYYNTGSSFRVYAGGNITFTGSVGVTITKIEFTFGTGDGTNEIKADCGTYSEGTWTGAASKIVFSVGGTSKHRRFATIKVTYSIDENVVVIATPSITAAESFVGSTTVEITNNEEGTTLYYSINGVDYFAYKEPFTIAETTTITAYAQDAQGNKSSVANATYTKIEILSIAEAKAAYDAAGANVAVAVDLTDAVVTVNSDSYLFIENATTGINIYNSGADYAVGTKFTKGYILGESAAYGTMHQITSAVFKDVETTTVTVEPTEVAIANLVGNNAEYEGRFVKLTGVSVDVANKTITQGEDTYALYNRFNLELSNAAMCDIEGVVAIYNTTEQLYITKVSPYYTLTVTEAGWATMFLDFATTIPANVECYVVTDIQGGYVIVEEVTGVLPASTGVIVKATAGEYKFEATAETASVENLLKGSTVSEVVTPAGTAYVLGINEGVVGLYKAELDENDGTAFLNNANKAYLVVPAASQAVQYFSFNFGAGTTGIEGVEAEGAVSGKIYDITGREVKAITTPGIYIVGGKKVVVK